MTSYATFTLNKRMALIFIFAFAILVVFDSTIVIFSSYSGVELPTSLHIAIFVIFFIIFVASNTILISSVWKLMSEYAYKPGPRGFTYFHIIIVATQTITAAIMLVIICQMLLLNKYSLNLLNAQIYLSHLSALVFLSSLTFLFSRWLNLKKKNYTAIL